LKKNKLRVIFCGTPEYAVPSLEAVAHNFDVVAVIAQPDKPAGRGGATIAVPIKRVAERLGIKVLQFEKIRDNADELKKIPCDVMITVAYGQILSKEILDIPKYGVINAHASLLPKYRGSSPIQWALIKGEKVTGVTIMQTAEGLDNGDILTKYPIDIAEDDNAGTLFPKLAELSAKALVESLPLIVSGKIKPLKQNETEATYFPLLRKVDGEIDFCMNAVDITNKVRGVNPWPGAYTMWGEQAVKIWETKVSGNRGATVGQVVVSSPKDGLVVACGGGETIEIVELQLAGGKRLNAREFLRGRIIPVGTVLG